MTQEQLWEHFALALKNADKEELETIFQAFIEVQAGDDAQVLALAQIEIAVSRVYRDLLG